MTGESYGIRFVVEDESAIAVFHLYGVPPAKRIVYVPTGTTLKLKGLSRCLQGTHNLRVEEEVKLIQKPHHADNWIVFASGKELPLMEFAEQGIAVHILELGGLEVHEDEDVIDVGPLLHVEPVDIQRIAA